MWIEICSRKRALELAAKARVRTSVISIVSKEEQDVEFPDNPNIVSILRLRFNDLTSEYDEEGLPYGRPLPQRSDFTGLKQFIDALGCESPDQPACECPDQPGCESLIVHCWEGASRSAAVAKAVYEYRGKKDVMRSERAEREGKSLSPNPLVYQLACQELRI